MLWLSHKIFFLPYSHFYGYMHFTLRSQDFMVVWQWDPKAVMELQFNVKKFKHPDFRYKGMLVYRRAVKSSTKYKMLQDDMFYDQWSDESDNQLEQRVVVELKPGKEESEQDEGGHSIDRREEVRRDRLELLQTMGPPCQIHPFDKMKVPKFEHEGGTEVNLDSSKNKLLGKASR